MENNFLFDVTQDLKSGAVEVKFYQTTYAAHTDKEKRELIGLFTRLRRLLISSLRPCCAEDESDDRPAYTLVMQDVTLEELDGDTRTP